MAQLLNHARMTVASAPGAGAATLNAAVTGYQTFAAAATSQGYTLATGAVLSMLVTDGTAWECSLWTYNSTGPTLTRATFIASSTGSALSLTAAAIFIASAGAVDIGLQFVSEQKAFTAQTTITFDVPLDARELIFELAAVSSTTGLTVTFSQAGTTKTSSYQGGNFIAASDTSYSAASSVTTAITIVPLAVTGVSGTVKVHRPNLTTIYKYLQSDLAFRTSAGTSGIISAGGFYTGSNAAIDKVIFNGFSMAGNIAMYKQVGPGL